MKNTYTFLFFLCFLTGYSCYSQNDTIPNTLLWRISGNGLQKPSYLYGTMHLTDDRLFNLGDSLLRAIEISDGFAMEISPDDFSLFLADFVKKSIIKNQEYVKDILSKKEYEKFRTALSKKFNKAANDITTQDIFLEKNKWINESFRKGKNPDILDAYLLDLARRQGKWLGGVEDVADQEGLLSDMVDESDIRQIASGNGTGSRAGLNTFVNAYVNSDLNAIEKMMNLNDSAYNDALLVKRNKKMTLRMDSLGHIRSMVFAVGAAHLPGQTGLVVLLRKKGFNVEPVFYSKKIKREDYKLKEVEIPWVDVIDPNGYYKVMMPGKPSDISMFGMVNMKFCFNIFTSAAYMVASFNIPYNAKGVDSLMGVFAAAVFKDRQMANAKSVSISGISGKEMEKNDLEGYRHGYMLYKNSVLYLTVAFSNSNNPKSLQEISKFLASYQPTENVIAETPSLHTFSDPVFAYSIELPSAPQPADELGDTTDKSIRHNLKICVDHQTGAYFMISVNETKPGYDIQNDSLTLANIFESVKGKFMTVSHDTTYVKDHRRILECEGSMKKVNLDVKSIYEMRGNRWYAVLGVYAPGKLNPTVDKVLHSFQLLTYQPTIWRNENPKDSIFSLWSPSKIIYLSKGMNDSNRFNRYETYDSVRSNTYDIVSERFGKYYWEQNDSAFWASFVSNDIFDNYTLLSQKRVHNGKLEGIEIEKEQKGSSQVLRKRVLLYGDSTYTLSTRQPESEIHERDVDRFFEEFMLKNDPPPTHVLQSKAKVLLDDLSSQDSATRESASENLSTAVFAPPEIPLLCQAVLKTYTTPEDNSINADIAEKLIDMHDTTFLAFAREEYLVTKDQAVKNALLDIISSFKTVENFKLMRELLRKSPPSADPSYTFRNNLEDSFSLTVTTLYPSILALLLDTTMVYPVLGVSSFLLDSNRIFIGMFRPYESTILEFAAKRYAALKADSSSYLGDDDALESILEKFNDKPSNDMLRKWLLINRNYLRMECVRSLLLNRQPLRLPPLMKLAKDNWFRADLYKELAKYNNLALFPKQYLSQSQIAKSLVYGLYSDEDDDDAIPDAVMPVLQKTALFKGKLAKFYFFKLVFNQNQDEEHYKLSCVGPFSTNQADMSVKEAFGEVYEKEAFDSANLRG
ncbi:MAG TPA: TraB/GumN family protein, partial [Puia sp.]|nr:TraB/GumN family protein [Puia sp.]